MPIDDSTKLKQASVSNTAENKKQNILWKSQNLHEVLLPDGDNITENQRLASNERGISLDAFETTKDDTWLNDPTGNFANRKKMLKQLHAASIVLNKDVKDTTNEDVFKLGDIGREKLRAAAFKGQEDPKQGFAKVDTQYLGKGLYGRDLIQARNPITGENLNNIMNTPETNPAYWSKYNRLQQIRDEQAKNPERDPNDPQPFLSDDVLYRNQAAQVTNAILGGAAMAADQLNTVPGGIAQAYDAFINNTANISPENKELFKSRRVKEDKIREAESLIEQLDTRPDSLDKRIKMGIARKQLLENKLTTKEKQLNFEMHTKGRGDIKSTYDALKDSEFTNELLIQPNKEASKFFQSVTNKREINKNLNIAKEENFNKINDQVKSGNYIGAAGNAIAGTWKVLKDPETVAMAISESLGYVGGNIASFGIAPFTRAATTTDKSYDEFIEKHDGRPPNEREQITMFSLNLASSLMDSSAGKYITTPRKQVAGDIERSLLKKVKDNATDIGKKGGVEYAQESVQAVLEDQASTQDISKTDIGAMAEGGAFGLAGGAGSAAITNIPSAAISTGQAAVKGTAKVKEKASEKLGKIIEKGEAASAATVQKEINEVTDTKNETYDAGTAVNVLSKNLIDTAPEDFPGRVEEISKHVSTIQKELLEEVEANGGTSKKAKELANKLSTATQVSNDAVAEYKKENVDTSIEKVSKATSPQQIVPADIDAIADEVYGSENIKSRYAKVIENENVPTDVKDLINSAVTLEDITKDSIKEIASYSGKSMEQVKKDILGVGISPDGFKSVGSHNADIKASLNANDQVATVEAITKLESFESSQKEKLHAYQSAGLGEAIKFRGRNVKFNDADVKANLIGQINSEIKVISASIDTAKAAAKQKFNPSPGNTVQTPTVEPKPVTPTSSTPETVTPVKAPPEPTTTAVKIDKILASMDPESLPIGIKNALKKDKNNSSLLDWFNANATNAKYAKKEGVQKPNKVSPPKVDAKPKVEKQVTTNRYAATPKKATPAKPKKATPKKATPKKASVKLNTLIKDIKTLRASNSIPSELSRELTYTIDVLDAVRANKSELGKNYVKELTKAIKDVKAAYDAAKEKAVSLTDTSIEPEKVKPTEVTSTKIEQADVGTFNAKNTPMFKNAVKPALYKEENILVYNEDSKEPTPYIGDMIEYSQRKDPKAIASIPNFFEAARNNPTELTAKYDLTEGEQAAFNKMSSFNQNFTETYNNLLVNMDGKVKKQDIDNPVNMLRNADGTMPAAIVDASSMVGMEYLATRASESVFNYKDNIKSILNLPSSTEHITPLSQEVLSYIGSVRASIAPSLGAKVMQQSGFYVKNSVDGYFQAKLELALGNQILQTLAKDGFVELNTITNGELNNLKPVNLRENKPTNPRANTNFVRMATQTDVLKEGYHQQVPVDKSQSVIDTLKDDNAKAVFDKLFGLGNEITGPTNEPVKEVAQTMRGTLQNVAGFVKSALSKQHKQKWLPRKNVFDIYNKLDKIQILDINGYVKEQDIDKEHVDDRPGVIGRNQQIIKAMTDVDTFMNDRDMSLPMYFTYSIWKNLRAGMESNTINPQTSIMHRHLFGAADWVTEVLLSDPIEAKLAIAESFGFKVDKKMNDKAIKYFDTEIMSADGVIQDELINEAIQAIQSKEAKLTPTQREAITNAAISNGEGMASLDGLIALADYQNAIQNGNHSFTASIFRETDGITNGVITALLQLAPGKDIEALKDMLKKGGVHFEDNTFNSQNEWFAEPGNYDSYENLAISLNTKLEEYKTRLKPEQLKRFTSLQNTVAIFVNQEEGKPDEVTSEGRNFTKPALMNTGYGQGIKGILVSKEIEVVQNVYGTITKLSQSKDPKDQSKLEALVNDLNNIVTDKISMVDVKDGANFKFTYKQEGDYVDLFSRTFGGALEETLIETLGDFSITRNFISGAIRILNEVFVYHYIKEVADAEKDKKTHLSKDEKEAIRIKLREKGIFTGFKHESSVDHADSLDLAKNEKVTISNEDGGKVKQNFSQGIPVNTFSINKDGLNVKPSKPVKSTQSNISINEPTGEVGASGFGVANQSTDGNMAAKSMYKHVMLNVFDAEGSGLNTIKDNTTENNEDYRDINTNYEKWSTLGAIDEAYKRALKMINEDAALKRSINAALYTKSILIDEIGYKNINTFTAALGNVIDQSQENQQQLRADATMWGQFNNEGSEAYSNVPVEESIEKTVTTQVDALVEEIKATATKPKEVSISKKDDGTNSIDNVLNNSPAEFDLKNFEEDYNKPLTASTAVQLFNDIENTSNKQDSQSHKDTLKDVMNNLITPALRTLDDLTLRVGKVKDITAGAYTFKKDTRENKTIYLGASEGITNNNTTMSAQELYTHELIHAIWEKGIETNQWTRRELKRLFKKAEKVIVWEDFLRTDDQGNFISRTSEAEEAAKARYDYVFNNPKGYLHEFATIGLTNESFMKALAKHDSFEERTILGNGIINGLYQAFMKLVEIISGAVYGTGNKNIQAALMQLAQNTTNIQSGAKTRLYKYMEVTGKMNSKAVALLNYAVFKPYTKISKKLIDNPPKPWPLKVLKEIATLPYNLHQLEWRKAINDVAYGLGLVKDNVVYKLFNEIAGPNKDTIAWHRLLRKSKHLLDQQREHVAANTTKYLVDAFGPDNQPTDAQWEAINDVMLKTDLSILAHKYNPAEIVELLGDSTKLATTIKKLKNQLQVFGKENANYYEIQAKSLGNYMVEGKVGIHLQMLNAFNIANLSYTDHKVEGDVAQAEAIIDELATLHALQVANYESKQVVAKLFESEYTRNKDINGISTMLNQAIYFKEDSLDKLFHGDKTATVKGYTKENYDSAISIKTGSLLDEKQFKSEGYTLVNDKPIEKDAVDPNSDTDAYLYISHQGLMNRYMSGALSQTNKKHMGVDLVEGLDAAGAANPYASSIVAKGVMERNMKTVGILEQQFKGKAKLNFNTNYMIPIVGARGKIKGYRYVMTEENKKVLMGKNDLAHEVMGRMAASVVDKTVSANINKEGLQLAKDDWDNRPKGSRRDFVRIGDTSTGKYADYYRMMPKDMRRDLKEIWGGKEMYIKEELLDLVFGYRKASFTNWLDGRFKKLAKDNHWTDIEKYGLPSQMKNAMRISGALWQAIVSKAKRNVVLLTPAVLTGNVISNYTLSIMKGVPPNYVAKEQLNAITALNNYRTLENKRDNLDRLIKITPNLKNKAMHQNKLARLNKDLEVNPVKDLIDAGLFQSITEDIIDDQDTVMDTLSRAFPKTKGFTSKVEEGIPHSIKRGYAQLTLDPSTKMGDFLKNATQYSDFVARYALYKFQTEEQGMSPKDSLDDVVETFINYDENTSKELQWMNDMGIMMYTKFLFRIQRVIYKTIRDRPAEALVLAAVDQLVYDHPDITDSNLITNTFIQRMEPPFSPDRLDEAYTWSLLNYVPGM